MPVAFTHVHSHEGNPLNELADALAKAAAKGDYSADIPSGVPAELYDPNHPLADWMWIVDTPASTKARYGFPPTNSNYIVCPLPNHPILQQLTQLVHTEALPTQVLRTFAGAFITFNCNSLKEGETPAQDAGVTPFPGKAALLERQFAEHSALNVGIQEAHSRSPSLSNLGHYIRVIPPFGGVDGPQGDVEIWVNSKQPWDPEDQATVIQEHHPQITAWGPKYFVLSIKNSWLRLDVVCAHAPHTWNDEARTRAHTFWSSLRKNNQEPPNTACPMPSVSRSQHRIDHVTSRQLPLRRSPNKGRRGRPHTGLPHPVK